MKKPHHVAGGSAEHQSDLLKAWRVTIPRPGEQRRIVAKTDELMTVCDELEAALRAGQNGRRRLLAALLHEALNGSGGVGAMAE